MTKPAIPKQRLATRSAPEIRMTTTTFELVCSAGGAVGAAEVASTPRVLGRWVLSSLLNLVHKLIDFGASDNANRHALRCWKSWCGSPSGRQAAASATQGKAPNTSLRKRPVSFTSISSCPWRIT